MHANSIDVYSWKEIVSEIKSPYNTYVFVSMRNFGKSKSIRNLVVELLKQIPHHNIILFSTTAHRELNDDYKFLQDSKYTKVYPGSKDEIDSHIDEILKHCKDMKAKHKGSNFSYSLMAIFDDIDVTKRNDKVTELFTRGGITISVSLSLHRMLHIFLIQQIDQTLTTLHLEK